jgi:hypothetical protein
VEAGEAKAARAVVVVEAAREVAPMVLTLGASEVNFLLLCYTGQSCDVSPFLDSYGTVENVQIASGATAWTDQDTGITHILVVHQGLWLCTKMPHLLMNPN